MSKGRFSKLKFKVYDLKEPVLKKYPELLRHKAIQEAQGLPHIDSILTYIVLLYDPSTDLNQECPDLKDRKAEACALSKLPKEQFNEFLEKSEAMMTLVKCFITEIYHARKHREWLTSQEELDYFTGLRWNPVDLDKFTPKQRGDLNSLCDQLHIKLDALEAEIFGDHEDTKEVVIADRWSSPEKFAAPTLKVING